MLVLTLDKEILADGSGIQHSIKRYVEYVGRFYGQVRCSHDIPTRETKKILSIIQEINLYLPDDWRMTRSKNNFRIFVQIEKKAEVESFVLVGRSFRQADDRVLHVVDTVLKPETLDNTDREALIRKGDINTSPKKMHRNVDDQFRMDHPEFVRPNLYFMKPLLDDCPSPLFARQYERVFENDTLHEFHKIRPLTKRGIDESIYRWIQWTCWGEAKIVKSPLPNSHGRDYWNVPSIGFEKSTRVLQEHARLLKENGITVKEGETQGSPYEMEYKLLFSGDLRDRQSLFDAAEEIIRRSELVIDARKSLIQNDTYVDDDNYTILSGGGSFRLRQTAETARLTLKAKRPDTVNSDGKYVRIENEQTISSQEANAFISNCMIDVAPIRALKERFPECGDVSPRAKVETTREILYARNKNGQDAEVCFDFVRFLDMSGREVGRDVEIEIESKGMPLTEIAKLADLLRIELNLEPSPRSKYERAIECYPERLSDGRKS